MYVCMNVYSFAYKPLTYTFKQFIHYKVSYHTISYIQIHTYIHTYYALTEQHDLLLQTLGGVSELTHVAKAKNRRDKSTAYKTFCTD